MQESQNTFEELAYSWISSLFLPARTGKPTHSDDILQMGLDFLLAVCSNSGTTLRMHHDGGAGQKAPPAPHLTVGFQFIEL